MRTGSRPRTPHLCPSGGATGGDLSRPGSHLFVFGSSLTSAYWNGAATYYRGLYKNLHARGHHITFAEPDIYGRQQHRDWEGDPPYAHCPIYRTRAELDALLRRAAVEADCIIKHSGVGAEDEYLEGAVLEAAAGSPRPQRPGTVYWDVDAPATLQAVEGGPGHGLRARLPRYDMVLTYGGGPGVVRRFLALGTRQCVPIYNGLDPDTHHPAAPEGRFRAEVTFLGHRLPDREERVRHFFLGAAKLCPGARFLLAGEGWQGLELPANVRACGYVGPGEHNALNASARWVLNLNRDSMAEAGFSPPTRIFEAAGAGAAVISDAWPGMALFFSPGREILEVSGPEALARIVQEQTPEAAAALGQRALQRALKQHTYARRAARVERILVGNIPAGRTSAAGAGDADAEAGAAWAA